MRHRSLLGWTLAGTVEPIRSVGINSQLAGAILRVNVEEGELGTGQVLPAAEKQLLLAPGERDCDTWSDRRNPLNP
ncbi:MAG TPA: hypothetical protein VJ650_08620 [Gemmatimonadaceae bacterium]|nr:hypothetical protein [Gemmatimonadaceae bacterium]